MSVKNLTEYKIEEINELNKKLIRLESNYDTLSAQIKSVNDNTNAYFERLLTEIKDLKNSLKTIDEMKIHDAVREAKINDHDKKLALMEKDLSDLKGNFREHATIEAATIKAVSKTVKIAGSIISFLLIIIFAYILNNISSLKEIKINSEKTESKKHFQENDKKGGF